MKRTFIGVCSLMLCFMLVACGNDFPDNLSSYYSNFTAKGEDDEYEISGKSQVVDTLHLINIFALEDTSVDLSGELKSVSGDVQIVYSNPDNKETVIYDSGSGKDVLNTTINLKKGESRLEFKGKESNFKFDMLFTNIDEDKVKFFDVGSKDDKLRKEISVTYTDRDDNCTILDTSLNNVTKIRVLINANVTNIEDKDNLSFDGFHLVYNTEDDNTIKVLKYKSNEFAVGGYEWQDSFVQEIELPKGENKLIFHSYGGTNYEIDLNIQVLEVG